MKLVVGSKGADVKHVQELLINVGYKLTADGDFGPKTLKVVRGFQDVHQLPDDGNIDDKDYAVLVVASSRQLGLANAKGLTTDAVAKAGISAALEASRLWQLDVFDPPKSDHSTLADASRSVINQILRDAGWGGYTPYLGNGEPQWCGLFAAACWRKAGIDPSWLSTYFASTYRLALWGAYQNFDAKHPNPRPSTGPYRLAASYNEKSTTLAFAPQIGDIVVVGDGNPMYGDHITILINYDEATKTFETISGNGGGHGPTGAVREGVSRQEFLLGGSGYHVRAVYRPAPSDLIIPANA